MRVLHIVGAMNLGGQETFIMNVYRNINREKIQFDFVVSNNMEGYFDNEIKKLGGNIYYIPPISKNVLKRCRALFKLINENKYDVVHRHSAFSIAFIDLVVAYLAGVKTRIMHSHADYDPHRLHPYLRFLVNLTSNYRLACSEQAGKWMFGGRSKSFEVINNGINIDQFEFNIESRRQLRKELGIDDTTILLGHTGRFTVEKNQPFLFSVLKVLLESHQNMKLCLLGDGQLRSNYEKQCKAFGIENNVFFLGARKNVGEYLSAFDLFLFPSTHEGLGISLIEAEVNGLTCIVSNMINEEAIISNKVTVLPLVENEWVKEIEKQKENVIHIKLEEADKFDIVSTLKKLESIYANSKTDKD